MFGVSVSRPDVNEFNRRLVGFDFPEIPVEIFDTPEETSHDTIMRLGAALIIIVRDVDDYIEAAGAPVSNVCHLRAFSLEKIVRVQGQLLDEAVVKSVEVIEDIRRIGFRV
jgi:hypothetical protein